MKISVKLSVVNFLKLWVPRGGEGGGGAGDGGGGGERRVTSYICHSTDVSAEWPPFSALPGI